MKQPFVLGLCGGSGAGKSTLAFGLADAYPGQATVFHIDDYFKPKEEVPVLHGMVNYDDPGALYDDKMASDLADLKNGKAVMINTKSPRLNPEFAKTEKRIPALFEPKPLIVVEGFMSLHFAKLRRLFDLSIYLEAPFDLHVSRRIHGKLHNFPANYNELVLKPMHEKYIFPSKKFADTIISVEGKTKDEILPEAKKLLVQAGWREAVQ